MKLILVYPPRGKSPADSAWFPLGIASMAANTTETKDIVCLDLIEFEISDAVAEIKRHMDPDKLNIVGLTIMTDQRAIGFKICKSLKSIFFGDYKVKTIVGGPHPSIMAEQIEKNYPELDFIVKGEGERALNLILKSIKNSESISKIVECEPIENLNMLTPATKGLKYFDPKPVIKEAPIVFSRGCDGHCTFCSTNKVWKKYRTRNVNSVYAEIMELKTQYGAEYFKFQDDSASSDMEGLRVLCRMLKDKGVAFEITTRIDRLDENLINRLSKAGCQQIAVGIESGSDKLRRQMGKVLDMDLVKHNTQYAQSLGIKVHFLLIVGYPGETHQTIDETCKMLHNIKPSSYSKLPGLMIVPGTTVYNKLKREGYIDDSFWLSEAECPYYTGEWSIEQLHRFGAKLNNAMRHYKVLIASVVNQTEEVFKEYLRHLDSLELDFNIEVQKMFVLHNSPQLKKYLAKNEYIEVIDKLEHNTNHQWDEAKLALMAREKNDIVKSFLKYGGLTHIFWVDSDCLIPPGTLKLLIYKQCPIIGACIWTKWPGFDREMPNGWDSNFYEFSQSPERFKTPGDYVVGGTGAVILVSRYVYEQGVNYNRIYSLPFTAWEDRAFCIRAAAQGFYIVLNTELGIKHLYTDELIKDHFKEKERVSNDRE
jgi:radical SAM superfamily enzyme YgiQ (UPF0313 family)